MPEIKSARRRGKSGRGRPHLFLHRSEKWRLTALRAASFLRFLDAHGCEYRRLSTHPPAYRVVSYPKNWSTGFLRRKADGAEPEFLAPPSLRVAPSNAPEFALGGPRGLSRPNGCDSASCSNCGWSGSVGECYRNDMSLRGRAAAPLAELDSYRRCPDCGEIAFCAVNSRIDDATSRETMIHRRENAVCDGNRRLMEAR